MNVGFRGRVFFVAVSIIVVVSVTSAIYLEQELRTWLEQRIEEEALDQAKAYRSRILVEESATTAEEFDHIIDSLVEAGDDHRVTLIRSDGTVLGDSNLDLERLLKVENHGERPEVRGALSSSAGIDRRRSKTLGVDTLYVAIPFKTPTVDGVLRVATPLALVDQAVFKMRLLLVFACVLGLVIAVLVSSVASYLLSRRLRNLIDRARSMADGDVSTGTYRAASAGEISMLHKSLHRLDDALEEIVQTLANERDRFGAVLEGMREAVLAVDREGIVTMVNQGAIKFLALDESPFGKHIRDVINSRDLLRSIKLALRGEAEEFDIDLQHDEVRYVMGRVVPYSQEGGCIVVIHDVTRLRRLERVRRDFVANVSHELRTPVSVIRLNAEMLKEGALTDPDAGPQFVDALYRNSERLSELISDLLDVSRLESGQFEVEPDLIKVIEVGHVAYDSVQQLAAERGTTVTMRIPSELEVTADRSALEHVLINLVQNAVCYTPEGGNVELEAKELDGNVRIEVRDDGPGIRPKYRKRIFERFYRVDKGRSKHMGGTGLGLSIVKHLVRIMEGEVGVTDNEPQGALFWVLLPGETGEEILASMDMDT